jgi:hypothetical protein
MGHENEYDAHSVQRGMQPTVGSVTDERDEIVLNHMTLSSTTRLVSLLYQGKGDRIPFLILSIEPCHTPC